MKYFVVAVILAVVCSAAAFSEEQKKIAEKFTFECINETGFKVDELQRFRAGPKDFFSDVKAQKFGKCFLTKLNFLDDKGVFQEKFAIEKLAKEDDRAKVEEFIKQCKDVIGTNKDEMPLRMYACYLEKKFE